MMDGLRFAERMSRLGTESAFEVLARARALEAQGKNVVHFEIGEPDFDTPDFIVEAAVKALREGYTHYGPAQGMPVLREAVAERLTATRSVDFSPEEVVIAPGAKPLLFFTILALVNPGDEVMYPDPGFPVYESVIRFVGGRPVPIKLREELDFRIDLDEFRNSVTSRTKLIILNSPHNPTGGVLTETDLEGIAEIIDERNLMVLSDEVYSEILHDKQFRSLASLPGMKGKVIVVDGFSKTYAMTGWRLGYLAAKNDLAEQVTRLMVNSNSCTASFVQLAGAAALNGPQDSVGAMVQEFRDRRELIVDGLRRIPGITCVMPDGAFYVFPNVSQTGLTARQFADSLLDQSGVALLAGTDFGAQGEGHVRLSYASSVETIKDGLIRIEKAVKRFQ